jgi:hypothetical protein
VKALVESVLLLPISKKWDELLEVEWGYLHNFLQVYGQALSSGERTVGLAIISIQKKLIYLFGKLSKTVIWLNRTKCCPGK